jgi:hypothetical protein
MLRPFSLWMLICGPVIGCAAPTQNVGEAAQTKEWRSRADSWQQRHEEQNKQVDHLLDILPKAAADVEPTTLQETYQGHRQLPDLVKALDRKIADAREAKENADRYRLRILCDNERDDGQFSVSLIRSGSKKRNKAARIKLIDRTYCPSTASVQISSPQIPAGDYQLQVNFQAAPGRPYRFSFSVLRYDATQHRDEVVCSAETSPSGPPTLNNVCDLTIKVAASADLPVAR